MWGATFFRNKGNRPSEDIHEVREHVRVNRVVVLLESDCVICLREEQTKMEVGNEKTKEGLHQT